MPRRTIPRSNVGPWTPEARDYIIDKWVEIAGKLPLRTFEVRQHTRSEVVTFNGSARDKLNEILEYAHLRYRFGGDEQYLASLKRRLAELRRVESAANRLLLSMGRDPGIVDALRNIAMAEVEPVREALRQTDVKLMGLSDRIFSPSSNVRMAIEGVEVLHRWAKAAAEKNARRIESARPSKDKSSRARHKGDVALNSYIEIVVAECWRGVWNLQIADGPKLWRFVIQAAAAVGVPLSEDASRERIRRVFNLRRANQGGTSLDLPTGTESRVGIVTTRVR